jgi:hypothetical protein
LLRSNVIDWTPEELWRAYVQLTEAEAAFRVHKSDLRQVFEELCEISLVDVVLPTRQGLEVRKRCIGQPTEHQRILLQRLGMRLPIALEQAQM